jgi:hypothetical protein
MVRLTGQEGLGKTDGQTDLTEWMGRRTGREEQCDKTEGRFVLEKCFIFAEKVTK